MLRLCCGAHKLYYGAHRENDEQTARNVSADASFNPHSFSLDFRFHDL
jgi:hypothetical protein